MVVYHSFASVDALFVNACMRLAMLGGEGDGQVAYEEFATWHSGVW